MTNFKENYIMTAIFIKKLIKLLLNIYIDYNDEQIDIPNENELSDILFTIVNQNSSEDEIDISSTLYNIQTGDLDIAMRKYISKAEFQKAAEYLSEICGFSNIESKTIGSKVEAEILNEYRQYLFDKDIIKLLENRNYILQDEIKSLKLQLSRIISDDAKFTPTNINIKSIKTCGVKYGFVPKVSSGTRYRNLDDCMTRENIDRTIYTDEKILALIKASKSRDNTRISITVSNKDMTFYFA